MTHYISYLLQLIGLVLLVIGYRKRHRNLLLAAALFMWSGGFFDDFARGFMDGIAQTQPA